jgi:hypothetical protein
MNTLLEGLRTQRPESFTAMPATEPSAVSRGHECDRSVNDEETFQLSFRRWETFFRLFPNQLSL